MTRISYITLTPVLMSLLTLLSPNSAGAKDSLASSIELPFESSGQFESIYEPSGVTQFGDNKLLLIEDEQHSAFSQLNFNQRTNESFFTKQTQLYAKGNALQRYATQFLDDLEGVARENAQFLVAVSSHNNSSAKKAVNRKKLIRFRVHDDAITDAAIRHDLREQLLSRYPVLQSEISRSKKTRKAGLNIEGIAFDRSRGHLLIGLRSPLIQGKAVIVRLRNPVEYISSGAEPDFSPKTNHLDLDGGGLRAMAYDDQTDQILMVSKRDKPNKKFKLWRVKSNIVDRAERIHTDISLDMVEGITPVQSSDDKHRGVLFVRDNGNARRKIGAEWFMLSRKKLGLDGRKFQ